MVAPRGTYTNVLIPSGYWHSFQYHQTWVTDPTPDGFFAACQFGLSDGVNPGPGGYIGTQTLGSGLSGKALVFSMAGTHVLDAAMPPLLAHGIIDDTFDGGPGWSTRGEYAWTVGTQMSLSVVKGAVDGSSQWWDAKIDGNTFASIKVDSTTWNMFGPLWFLEDYSTPPASCSLIRHATVRFENFFAEATPAYQYDSFVGAGDCPARVSALPEGALHENGVGTIPRRITATIYEQDNLTKVGDLATAITGSPNWTDVYNDFGNAGVKVPLYLPDSGLTTMLPNGEAGSLTRGRIIRFALDGIDRFPAVVRPRRQQSVHPNGHSQLSREVQCKGLMSEWDRAVIPPAPGAQFFPGGDTRQAGWMSHEADTTTLSAPAVVREVFRSGYPQPEPWLDDFGAIFSAATNRYFIFDQTISSGDVSGLPDSALSMDAHFAAADRITVWVNGCPAGQTDLPPASAWATTNHCGAKLPIGTHRWAFDVQGLPDAPDPRFAVTAYKVNDPTTGVMSGDTILWRSGYITGVTPYPWKASATPHGPTAKQIIRSFLTQVQTEQGLLTDWELFGDDDLYDANGQLLDHIEHIPFTVGDAMGTGFLLPLAKAWCDLRVSVAGKRLYVYRWRERGNHHQNPSTYPVFSDAIFSPVDGRIPNIISLSHEERIT